MSAPSTSIAPVLHLDGFDGPLDLLLDLARAQKVDLARISILALVEQYLAAVEAARAVRLELAADWLVMAAWLAWLKSRLLLPADPAAAEEGEIAAEVLAARLAELEAMVAAARRLAARPQLGLDQFARGAPEDLVEIDRSELALDLPQLMTAWLGLVRRTAPRRVYRPRPIRFWTTQDALRRLGRMLGTLPPGWNRLDRFLPESGEAEAADPRQHRAALASTLLAGLELARDGAVELHQEDGFGPILLRAANDTSPTPQEAAHG